MISAETLIAEQQQFFEELRYNKDRFRDFLHTMVHHYRQPVDRQVQIFFLNYSTSKGSGLSIPCHN